MPPAPPMEYTTRAGTGPPSSAKARACPLTATGSSVVIDQLMVEGLKAALWVTVKGIGGLVPSDV